MRIHSFDPPKQFLPLLTCSACGAIMWLTRIEPDDPGYDRRTFECPHCEHVSEMVVALDEPAPGV